MGLQNGLDLVDINVCHISQVMLNWSMNVALTTNCFSKLTLSGADQTDAYFVIFLTVCVDLVDANVPNPYNLKILVKLYMY